MDTQLAHRLQATEQAKEQCQSFQMSRKANQLAQALPTDKTDSIHHQDKLSQLNIQAIMKLNEI